jgi:hypothetical protein
MTLNDLIEQLTDFRDSGGVPGDTEVRLAHQPNYPFEYDIDGVSLYEYEPEDDWGADPSLTDSQKAQAREAQDREKEANPTVVYIVEGSQRGYLSGDAAKACGWRG